MYSIFNRKKWAIKSSFTSGNRRVCFFFSGYRRQLWKIRHFLKRQFSLCWCKCAPLIQRAFRISLAIGCRFAMYMRIKIANFSIFSMLLQLLTAPPPPLPWATSYKGTVPLPGTHFQCSSPLIYSLFIHSLSNCFSSPLLVVVSSCFLFYFLSPHYWPLWWCLTFLPSIFPVLLCFHNLFCFLVRIHTII